jgi:hypothetical protein
MKELYRQFLIFAVAMSAFLVILKCFGRIDWSWTSALTPVLVAILLQASAWLLKRCANIAESISVKNESKN